MWQFHSYFSGYFAKWATFWLVLQLLSFWKRVPTVYLGSLAAISESPTVNKLVFTVRMIAWATCSCSIPSLYTLQRSNLLTCPPIALFFGEYVSRNCGAIISRMMLGKCFVLHSFLYIKYTGSNLVILLVIWWLDTFIGHIHVLCCICRLFSLGYKSDVEFVLLSPTRLFSLASGLV